MVFKTNNFDEFNIRKANQSDIGSILKILKSAAKWV